MVENTFHQTRLRAYLYDANNGPRCLPRLLTADEAAEKIQGITATRLCQLAEAEAIPHARVDGGPPLFYEPDLKAFVRDKLTVYIGADGPLPEPVVVYLSKPLENVTAVPEPLMEYAARLREVPLQTPLEQPCVYFLLLESEIVYVGQTTNLFARLGQHWRDGKRFERVLFLLVPQERLLAVESQFIKALRPSLNR